MMAILMLFANAFGGPLIGAAERWLRRRQDAMREDKVMAHRERLAELNYREGRNAQLAAIQGADRGWSPSNIVRLGFAAPFVLLINFLVWHWMLTGSWYEVNDMPQIVRWVMLGVLNFYLLFESVNAHGAFRMRTAILSDPEHARALEEAGRRREAAFRSRHGPKGQ